jgi:dCTP deaminase
LSALRCEPVILSHQSIKRRGIMKPYCERTEFKDGRGQVYTHGCGPAGYDVRVEFDADGGFGCVLLRPEQFILASTVEQFTMPDDVLGVVHDKSSWARRGLAVQNTVIEPGWSGYLTLEITNHSKRVIRIDCGCPIAQVVFHLLDEPTDLPYNGKYQHQGRGPVQAR